MRNMGTKEAADAIRAVVKRDRSSRDDPAHLHGLNFVKEVCGLLGLEASPENVAHVGTVLREHGIALPSGQEFPKYVTRKSDGTAHVVHSAAEEDEVVNGVPDSGDQPEPVQDTSLDLQNKVEGGFDLDNPQEHHDDDKLVVDNNPAHDQPAAEPEAPAPKLKNKRPV